MLLSSLQNPRVKFVRKLRDRRWRDKEKLTLLEGYRELSRALEYGMEIVEAFYCPSMFLGENETKLLDALTKAGARIDEVTESVLRKLAYRDRPEGLIAVAKIRGHRLDALPVESNGLYLVAEAIEKPGNLGAMLRSADAAGVVGVILCDKRTDVYNPNVIRSSTGALFSVPLAEADPDETKRWLRERNIRTVAATPHAETIYSDVDLTQGVAVVVGAEQYGLSETWLSEADLQVRIPMLGKIDSLNVATATTLLLYEAARQRGWPSGNSLSFDEDNDEDNDKDNDKDNDEETHCQPTAGPPRRNN